MNNNEKRGIWKRVKDINKGIVWYILCIYVFIYENVIMNFIILHINPEEINHDLQNPELNTHVHCQMIFW